jgi:hypothetical protein
VGLPIQSERLPEREEKGSNPIRAGPVRRLGAWSFGTAEPIMALARIWILHTHVKLAAL